MNVGNSRTICPSPIASHNKSLTRDNLARLNCPWFSKDAKSSEEQTPSQAAHSEIGDLSQ
jgi:hypothetical protein